MVDKGCSTVTKRVIIIASEHPGRICGLLIMMTTESKTCPQCTVVRTWTFLPLIWYFVSVWYLAHFTVSGDGPAIKIFISFWKTFFTIWNIKSITWDNDISLKFCFQFFLQNSYYKVRYIICKLKRFDDASKTTWRENALYLLNLRDLFD